MAEWLNGYPLKSEKPPHLNINIFTYLPKKVHKNKAKILRLSLGNLKNPSTFVNQLTIHN
jgi:hypothetical protein